MLGKMFSIKLKIRELGKKKIVGNFYFWNEVGVMGMDGW